MEFSRKALAFGLIVIMVMTIILIGVTDHYILTIDFYANSGDPVAGLTFQKQAIFDNLQRWIYLSSAIYLIAKLFLIALVLYTALYLFRYQVRFREILQVCVYSEFIFFVPALAKIILFHKYCANCTLSDWHKFYIWSALSIFENAPADWTYALQTLNVFELAYWLALAFGIKKACKITFDRSLQVVLLSYVPSLLIWIAAITFFTLMMFPNSG